MISEKVAALLGVPLLEIASKRANNSDYVFLIHAAHERLERLSPYETGSRFSESRK